MSEIINAELQARINSYADALTLKMHTGWGEWAQRIKFIPETATKGQKYIRIVQDEGTGRGGSIHAFIALETGGVHKSASWKSPARGRDGKVYAPKFNLLDDASFEALLFNLDTSGGYLYSDYRIKTPVAFVPEMQESI